MYLLLAVLGPCCCTWAFSSCIEQGCCFLWCMGSLLWPLVAEHRLSSTGSVMAAHWLSCPMACGIFPDQGSNPCPLHWQVDL